MLRLHGIVKSRMCCSFTTRKAVLAINPSFNACIINKSGVQPPQTTWSVSSSSSAPDAANHPGQLKVPDFEDYKEVYKSKSMKELLRAFFVFNLCSVDSFVDNQVKLLTWARKLSGRWLFRHFMKATMYGQFLGGEKKPEILARCRQLTDAGLYPMFAYTAAEVHGISDDPVPGTVEKVWTNNFKSLKTAIDMVSEAKALSAITPQLSAKLTFLADVELLRRVSCVILHNEAALTRALGALSEDSAAVKLKQAIDQLQLDTDWPGFGKRNRMSSVQGLLTHMPFHVSSSLHDSHFKDAGLKTPSPDDYAALVELWIKLKDLGQRAKEHGIHLIWDAEQTYLQPAIEAFILDSIRLFNSKETVIYNTYQCYLKRTRGIFKRDMAIVASEGLSLGCKFVRGAYMDEERRLSQQQGYDDPVNDNYDATTLNYHTIADLALDTIEVNQSQGCHKDLLAIFATHNADTVKFVLQGLQNRKINTQDGSVRFAQLYGMRDHISFALGHHGYPAAKLLHFGDIEEGVAYLSRRAHENRSGIPTASLERQMLRREITRRFLCR